MITARRMTDNETMLVTALGESTGAMLIMLAMIRDMRRVGKRIGLLSPERMARLAMHEKMLDDRITDNAQVIAQMKKPT